MQIIKTFLIMTFRTFRTSPVKHLLPKNAVSYSATMNQICNGEFLLGCITCTVLSHTGLAPNKPAPWMGHGRAPPYGKSLLFQHQEHAVPETFGGSSPLWA